ncbi:multicopper oxidase family protein [Effusibacillus consociatus]|uniref:Multicopper oxidase family protein n=1 Tax=Effusibacillus consociatus TaxID=1117041 RepID=A0ABV9Q0U6_9BACL
MKSKFRVRGILLGILLLLVIGIFFSNVIPARRWLSSIFLSSKGETALLIPQILEDQNPSSELAEYNLTAQRSTKEFIKGIKTETYGYNGDYLGPVIRVKKGETVSIKLKNLLGETTTVHWHGLELPGDMDGGPHNGIQPNETWNPQFTINQSAATLWFHPHPIHKTGAQVYKGLAGLIYIEDEVSQKLNLPKDYGQNDFPLILQDRRFTKDGRMPYDLGMMDVMHGFQGDTVLINGAVNPFLEVPQGKVRFRILNGSNARIYNLHLTKTSEFWQIASDGGFLEAPVRLNQVDLGPAERAEIIVDFSNFKTGEVIQLQDRDENLMKFIVKDKSTKNVTIPKSITSIPKIEPSSAKTTRKFVFQGMGHMVNINGKQMDPRRIDEELKINTTEIWEISNASTGMMGGGMAHPFHAHGVQFQILERNGKEPPKNERGWKDTILVQPGETVKAIATFKYKGIFMYHCHILEHEDSGMMGQFQVK